MRETADKNRTIFVYLALTAITLAVYWQVRNFEFINYDDDEYVTRNNHICSGLKLDNVIWVFTHQHSCNWHPLTGLSHMLDCQLFGLKPGYHHFINLLFHIANTLLLFTVLRQMTGAVWQSAFAAAVFAIHPLHVESVAWIAERKDVLSTLFWLLTMIAYFRYVKRPAISRYLLTLALFTCALMSKPMAVTLPFVLLLMDYWPLGRIKGQKAEDTPQKVSAVWLITEKIPFFALSAVSCIITLFIQQSGGALKMNEYFPFSVRLANALVSYIIYIAKMFYPCCLSVFYPHPRHALPLWEPISSLLILAVISAAVIYMGRSRPYLPAGWFWFLGTLVPVIGLVQAGSQRMADRYTYVPLTGLFIIIAWGTNDLLKNRRHRKIVLGVLSTAVILVLSVCTWVQLGHWRNSKALFEYALKVTNNNYLAHTNLGMVLLEQSSLEDAINHLNRALQIKPNLAEAYNNLGMAYGKLGRLREAVTACKEAIKLKPGLASSYNNLGATYGQLGRYTEATEVLRQAVQIKPDFADAHLNLGRAYIMAGDKNSAMAEHEVLRKLDAEKAKQLAVLMRK